MLPLSEKGCMCRKIMVYIYIYVGFGPVHGFGHPVGFLECISADKEGLL